MDKAEILRNVVREVIQEEYATHSRWFKSWIMSQWNAAINNPEKVQEIMNDTGLDFRHLKVFGDQEAYKKISILLYGSVHNALQQFKQPSQMRDAPMIS